MPVESLLGVNNIMTYRHLAVASVIFGLTIAPAFAGLLDDIRESVRETRDSIREVRQDISDTSREVDGLREDVAGSSDGECTDRECDQPVGRSRQ